MSFARRRERTARPSGAKGRHAPCATFHPLGWNGGPRGRGRRGARALIAYVDALETYRFVNAAYGTYFGRDAASLVGRPIREVLGDAAYESVRHHVRDALSGRTVRFVTEMAYRDVARRWVEATYTPDVAGDGTVRGFSALVVDVTARRLAERAAAVERENFYSLPDQVPAAIAVVRGPDHVYELSNPLNQMFVGGRALVGRSVRERCPRSRGKA